MKLLISMLAIFELCACTSSSPAAEPPGRGPAQTQGVSQDESLRLVSVCAYPKGIYFELYARRFVNREDTEIVEIRQFKANGAGPHILKRDHSDEQSPDFFRLALSQAEMMAKSGMCKNQ